MAQPLTLNDVNFLAVLVAAVAYFALGFVWYHPKVFGTKWAKLSGRSMDDMGKGVATPMAVGAIASLVSALALAVLIVIYDAQHWVDGLGIGAFVGVGFLLPVLGTQYAYGGKSMSLYFIDLVYHLLGFILMGVILAVL